MPTFPSQEQLDHLLVAADVILHNEEVNQVHIHLIQQVRRGNPHKISNIQKARPLLSFSIVNRTYSHAIVQSSNNRFRLPINKHNQQESLLRNKKLARGRK
jgi:hypothetical protein